MYRCKVCGNNVPVDDSLRRASCCKCNTVYVRREIAYVCPVCRITYHFHYEFVTEDEFRKRQLRRVIEPCDQCKEDWEVE